MVEDHAAGRAVPPAWEVALNAAAEADHSAGQDMLLAVNAHVQRDMPLALAEVKLRAPDGTSRKADHDRVNQVLHRAYDDIVSEVAARYDPNFGKLTGQPADADRTTFTQLLAAWREGAWRNAERLTAATDPAQRQVVVATIEANAHAWAEGFARRQAPGYRKLRADHCREHRRG